MVNRNSMAIFKVTKTISLRYNWSRDIHGVCLLDTLGKECVPSLVLLSESRLVRPLCTLKNLSLFSTFLAGRHFSLGLGLSLVCETG